MLRKNRPGRKEIRQKAAQDRAIAFTGLVQFALENPGQPRSDAVQKHITNNKLEQK